MLTFKARLSNSWPMDHIWLMILAYLAQLANNKVVLFYSALAKQRRRDEEILELRADKNHFIWCF